jgi:SSS family transporter
MSAGTAIGTVGFHYQSGYSYAWIWIAIWVAYIIMTFVMAPKMKALFTSHGALTIPDLLGTRYNSVAIRVVAVIILVAAFGLTIVAELVGGSYVLTTVFGLPKTVGVLAIAAVFITYTLLGGMYAIAYTDVLQMAVFVAGFAIAVPYAIHRAGGFPAMNEGLADISSSLVHNGMPGSVLAGAGIAFFIMMLGYPAIAVRFYSIKDTRTIRRAVGFSIVLQAIIAVSVTLLGVSARVIFPDLSSPDLATTTIATDLLPPLVGGLLLAAILAAIQASVSAVLLMLGSAVSHDIVKKALGKQLSDRNQVRLTRLVVLLMGLVPIPLALHPLPLIQQIWINAAALIGSSFAVPNLLGMVWRRATGAGALSAMIGGVLSASLWLILGNPFGIQAVYVSVPLSLLLMVSVSLLTPPSPRHALAPFFAGLRPEPAAVPGAPA